MTAQRPVFGARIAFVTCPDLEAERCEAPCVNILPGLESAYRWENGVETDAEILLLLIGTRSTCMDVVPARVAEFPAVGPVGGARSDLDWLEEEACSDE